MYKSRTYKNTETGEIHVEFLKDSEHEQYQKDNPKEEVVIGGMNIGDPYHLGLKKPPSDFSKYVLGRVKGNLPSGTQALERRHHIEREW